MESLKPIEDVFRANGYEYVLLDSKIVGDRAVCLYCGIHGYEVHVQLLRVPRGVLLNSPKYVGYSHYWKRPSNEDFGTYGWALSSEGSARGMYRKKIEEMSRKIEEKTGTEI